MSDEPFWRVKRLDEMSKKEWEQLCDGCAKCCLVKLEDEETNELIYTDVGCDLLDAGTCRCTDYPNRNKRVPDCIPLTPKNLEEIDWMPPSCAYRRLKEGRGLPWWHPLRSGEYRTVIDAGMSVQGRFIYEADVKDDIEDREASWPFDDKDELGDEADD